MNVLFVSAEVAPFAKAGGLGDVVGSLPKALRQAGVDARVLLPLHGNIQRETYGIHYLFSFPFSFRRGTADIYVHTVEYDGVPIYFLENWPYFGYGTPLYSDWSWDVPRYIFFSQAVMGAAWALKDGLGGEAWFPGVIHANDWHTALTPFLVNEARYDWVWEGVGTVLTLHNMAYQGPYAGGFLWDAGVHGRHQADLVYQDLTDNLLAIGLAYSDKINTVSPRYAAEILGDRFGEGLQGLLKVRQPDLSGILNGIDMERWNPATDAWIEHHYSIDNFVQGKAANKASLQHMMRLPVRADVPLVGFVTRLVDQKGVDLAIPALRQLLYDYDFQFVGLGTGEPTLEREISQLCNQFPHKARMLLKYDAVLSQRIYAGSDLFLMPSRYEPCGTSQMLSMRYGTLPIVRETGGLADTVQNYDNGDADYGTGFVFLWEESQAVLNTMRWALDTYWGRPEAFRRMQHRAMEQDFSWNRSALEYIKLYEQSMARHRR